MDTALDTGEGRAALPDRKGPVTRREPAGTWLLSCILAGAVSIGNMTDSWAGLADAVKGIRAELDAAMAEGVGNNVQFEVGPVELEFAVDIQKDAKADFGVRVWVLSLAAKGGAGQDSTNRIKVVLNPKNEHGKQLKISSDRDPGLPERTRAGN